MRPKRLLSAALLVPLLLAACERDDDLPPPIPLPGAAAQPPAPPQAPQAPAPPAAPAPPPAAPAPPSAPAPGGGPAPAAPADPGVPSGVPASPFNFPWPLPLPSSIPQIPGLPALPSIPGMPGLGALPTAPSPSAQPKGDARVTVYGTTWCGACKKLRADLAARKVPYEWVDLEDPKAGNRGAEVPANARGSVPVTRVIQRNGQTVWVKGCDPDRIEKAYRA